MVLFFVRTQLNQCSPFYYVGHITEQFLTAVYRLKNTVVWPIVNEKYKMFHFRWVPARLGDARRPCCGHAVADSPRRGTHAPPQIIHRDLKGVCSVCMFL